MESSEGSTMVPEPTHNLNCLEFGAPRASEPAIFACPYHGRDRHTERGGMFLPQSSNMLAAEVRLQEQSRSHGHIPRTYHDLFFVCAGASTLPLVCSLQVRCRQPLQQSLLLQCSVGVGDPFFLV